MTKLALTPAQMQILLDVLEKHLPGISVWAYGSRVRGLERPGSDLDLVVFASSSQARNVEALKDALDESDLPFLVDIHRWDSLPESFQDNIRRQYVVIC